MAKNKTVNINIRVTEEEFNRLSKFAELLNVNNSSAVRKMIKEYIEMYKDPRSKDDDLNTWKLRNDRVVPMRITIDKNGLGDLKKARFSLDQVIHYIEGRNGDENE